MLPMLTTSGMLRSCTQLPQVVVDVVGAGHGTSGRLDPQHHGLDTLVFTDPVDLPFDEPVTLQDDTPHGDNSHFVGAVFCTRVILLANSLAGVVIVAAHRPLAR